MSKQKVPTILVIDDRDDLKAFKTSLEIRGLAKARIRHPQEVELDDLIRADLVLVDYELTEWPQRDELSALALKPSDGLALIGVLQRHIYEKAGRSPTAFAIYTGKYGNLAAPLPPEYREHILAHINNVEWVFQKGKRDGSDQIAELASAVQALPQLWPTQEGRQMKCLAMLLSIPFKKDGFQERLLEDVATCLPPIHELSQWSHGHAVLRWLLHRILPYPCFLWDAFHLAARFRIDHQELSKALSTGKPLRKKLRACEYRGILSNFLGPRWWRASVEQFLWEETKGNSSDVAAVVARIRKHARAKLSSSVPADYPLVCLDKNYRPLGEFYSIKESVRIHPDDWPAYAEQAWTTIALAKNEPKLRALVIQEDREKLK
jgi:hypothetical protein